VIEKTVGQVFRRFGVEKQFGANVKTSSNIPVARGLKSSSAAANAVALATVFGFGEGIGRFSVINLGVDAAFERRSPLRRVR